MGWSQRVWVLVWKQSSVPGATAVSSATRCCDKEPQPCGTAYLGREMLLVPRILLRNLLPAPPGGEQECTWSGTDPLQPSRVIPHLARVSHTPAQLGRDAQGDRAECPRHRARLTWHGSSAHGHAAGPPCPCQRPRQPCPAAPGQAALALHGPGHPPPETQGCVRRVRGTGGSAEHGGCGMWCNRALPSLTCPSVVQPGRTGCAGADSGSRPSRAQQGDPSGARAVLTAPSIPGN